MKIGLIGEASSDTGAIKNLLSKRYSNLEFIVLLNSLTGSLMDSKKFIASYLPIELHDKKPDLVILIRDLDSHEKDKSKIGERKKIFTFLNKRITDKGLFLLNIYELEALIFADIDKFNRRYGCSIGSTKDPMKIPDPKGELMRATAGKKNRFNVSHNPEMFKLLDFDTVVKNCRYFAGFILEFEERLLHVS